LKHGYTSTFDRTQTRSGLTRLLVQNEREGLREVRCRRTRYTKNAVLMRLVCELNFIWSVFRSTSLEYDRHLHSPREHHSCAFHTSNSCTQQRQPNTTPVSAKHGRSHYQALRSQFGSCTKPPNTLLPVCSNGCPTTIFRKRSSPRRRSSITASSKRFK